MATKADEKEVKIETLSEEFGNQIEDFAVFDDDESVIDLKLSDDETELTPVETKKDEPQPDEFSNFLGSLPENTDVTIVVSRKPDYNLNFRIPCTTYGHQETLYWTGQTAPEIYDDIKKRLGGGRYQFQLRKGKGFEKGSWEITILDPSTPSEAEQTLQKEKAKADEQRRTNETSQVFANAEPEKKSSSIDEFISEFEKFEKFKKLITPEQPAAAPVADSLSFEERIALKLFENPSSDKQLHGKIVDYAFGVFEQKKNEKPSFAGIVADALKNPEQAEGIIKTVVGVLPALLSMFGGGSSPTAQPPPSAGMSSLVNFPTTQPQTTAQPPSVNSPGQSQPAEPEIVNDREPEFEAAPVLSVPALPRVEWSS
jgi:hypothetical protein